MLTLIFPHGLKGVIFDCDGVMIDSENANRHWYNAVLARFDLPPMTKEQEEYAFMAAAMDALRKMIPEKFHDKIPGAIEEAIDYQKDVLPKIILMPGFRKFIEDAHERGLLLAIDTNRTAEGIQRVLDFFNLPPYFDPVISSSIALPKPSPEGIKMICAAWKAQPDQVLFVGDSENDCNTAANAGALFAAFANKACRGDIAVADYSALAEILWGENLKMN